MTSDCTIVTSEQHLYQTIIQFDETIVLPRKLATGNIHDYLFGTAPIVGILFEILRIVHPYVVNAFRVLQYYSNASLLCENIQII